jgi:outer membrane protein TolC
MTDSQHSSYALDSERPAHQSHRSLAQIPSAAWTDLVAVFKALGGGWQE